MTFKYTGGRLQQVAQRGVPTDSNSTYRDLCEFNPDEAKEYRRLYYQEQASLLSYTAYPTDWKEGEIVGEGQFVLQHQMVTSPVHLKNMVQIWEDCSERDYNHLRPEFKRILARRVKKPDCSQHPKDLFGHTDMKEVAEAIGNLHYQSLAELFAHLSRKINYDAEKDHDAGKEKTADALQYLGMGLFESALRAEKLWKVVKPFMNNETK